MVMIDRLFELVPADNKGECWPVRRAEVIAFGKATVTNVALFVLATAVAHLSVAEFCVGLIKTVLPLGKFAVTTRLCDFDFGTGTMTFLVTPLIVIVAV